MPTAIASIGFAPSRPAMKGRIDRTSDGTLWAIQAGGGHSYSFWYSKDNGATWTNGKTYDAVSGNYSGYSSGSFGSLTTVKLFIDKDDNFHIVSQENFNGWWLYDCWTPDAGRTTVNRVASYFWNTDDSIGGTDLELIVHRSGTGWMVHTVSFTTGLATGAQWCRALLSSAYALGSRSTTSLSSSANIVGVGIDFTHTGDGKTVLGHADLHFVVLSNSTTVGQNYRKATTTNDSTWTLQANRTFESGSGSRLFSANTNGDWASLFWDGSRAVIAGMPTNGSGGLDLVVWERDAGDTTTSIHVVASALSTADRMISGGASYDTSGNVYFFGSSADSSNGNQKFQTRNWTRATNTLSALNVIDATAQSSPLVSIRPGGLRFNRIELVYSDGGNLTYAGVVFNAAPNAPGSLSPTGSASIDRTIVQRFSWAFSDPDAGDTQSAFVIAYRLVGAGTWNYTSIQTTTNQFIDFAANYFAAGDYEWQVQTYDALGTSGPFSASSYFTAASPPATPTITAPVSGGVVAITPYAISWSAPNQTDFQVRRVADNAGAPDTSIVYYDSLDRVDASARSFSIPFETNNRYEHVQVRVKYAGLWSAWASNRVQVSYNPPPAPTGLIVTPNQNGGYTDLAWVNPAPGAGQVAISYCDVYRYNPATGEDKRIATGVLLTTFRDWTPASGVTYTYRVIAYASNGVSTSSAGVAGTLTLRGTWIADSDDFSTARKFSWDGHGRSLDRELESAEMAYVGRVNPVMEWGTSERTTVNITLPLDDDTADYSAMNSFVSLRRPLLYRDGRGRKYFVAITGLPTEDKAYGGEMDLQALVVDGTDAV